MKSLSEQEWRRVSRGHGLKDASLVKAFAALEKAPDLAARLSALKEVDKQLDALRKISKADKDISGFLDDADKAVAKDMKETEAGARKGAREADDAEEDSPAQLTVKLIPLLRGVRKGDPMKVLVAIGGKACAVLLTRKAVGATQRKLLADHLGVGGLRFLPGECIWEKNAYTFVLKAQAGGMAKKVRAALLTQTGANFKVRVRGEDPDDIDDDGEPDETDPREQAATGAKPTASAQRTEAASPEKEIAARLQARMKALTPRLLATLKAQAPDASKLRLVAEFVREKIDLGEHKAALAAMDRLEKMLTADAAKAQPASGNGVKPTGKVDYAKCRLAWEGARKAVQAELLKLERAILDEYRDAQGIDQIKVKLRKLDTVMGQFARDLDDTLDKALNETQAAQRENYHRQASAQIRQFLDRAANDPFITLLETNPFVPIKAQATLVATLSILAKTIT